MLQCGSHCRVAVLQFGSRFLTCGDRPQCTNACCTTAAFPARSQNSRRGTLSAASSALARPTLEPPFLPPEPPPGSPGRSLFWRAAAATALARSVLVTTLGAPHDCRDEGFR